MSKRVREIKRVLTRKWFVLALLVVAVVTAVMLVAAALGWWRVLAVGGVLWASGLSIVLIRNYQVNRRVDRRTHQGVVNGYVETQPSAKDPLLNPRRSPDPAEAAGVARLLQAQYIGRLDRAEAALARAVARLDETGAGPREAGDGARPRDL